MENTINVKVNPKELIYFIIRLIVSIGAYIYLGFLVWYAYNYDDQRLAFFSIFLIYSAFILLYLFFRLALFIGFIKGNSIKITNEQFPDIYAIVQQQAERLQMSKTPTVYIMQSGGLLNAFATQFMGTNFIVLYSEIVESAYESNPKMLEFIIGHELGHLKQKHLFKNIILLPSFLIPFLAAAYSRACEYTCDSIGADLCSEGAIDGLLLLAAGRGLYKKINIKEYIKQQTNDESFWKWVSEKVSLHPNLTNRIEHIDYELFQNSLK